MTRQAAAEVTWRMYLLMVDPNGQRRTQQARAAHHAYTPILTD